MNDNAQWIKDHMTVDEGDVIAEFRSEIASYICVTKDGKVIINEGGQGMQQKDLIELFLIGKYMSNIAGYLTSPHIKNKIISAELGIPEGSVRRCIVELRKSGNIITSNDGNKIIINKIPLFLKSISIKPQS